MLKETYLGNIRNVPDGAVVEIVTRKKEHLLSPSWKLIRDYKEKRATWEEYVRRFWQEMDNPACKKEIERIKTLAIEKDVYLVCYERPGENCHRHLLVDKIGGMLIESEIEEMSSYHDHCSTLCPEYYTCVAKCQADCEFEVGKM